MPALALIVLRTTRPTETRAFYEALGLSFREEKHGAGPAHASTTLEGGVVLELYPAREGEAVDATRLGLRVNDLESTLRRLATLGVAPREGTSVVTDPDDRKVELTG